ncbi:MAG: hypothetical protein K2O84_11585 [Oscillospiraceae bacterium]|nr:hypothetical protein [Oscillospiraceae bacterium]
MKNELLDKGIILPSGEIGKDKINLVAGGQPLLLVCREQAPVSLRPAS